MSVFISSFSRAQYLYAIILFDMEGYAFRQMNYDKMVKKGWKG